jgi:hypothetical protein
VAALVDKEYLKEAFKLPEPVGVRAAAFIPSASVRLRRAIGAAAYDDAAGDPAADPERQADLRLAEAHFVMYLALPSLATTARVSGVVGTEKAEGGAILNYRNPQEIAAARASYMSVTVDLVSRHAPGFNATMLLDAQSSRGGSGSTVAVDTVVVWK